MIGMLYPLPIVSLHGGSPWQLVVALVYCAIVFWLYRDLFGIKKK